MKLIDKLKNALFEEEYVEIEEKPKKVKDKSKNKKVDIVYNDSYEEEKPIAKRIVPQEKKIIEPLEEKEEDIIDSGLGIQPASQFEESKITVVNDEDLKPDDDYQSTSMNVTKRRSDTYSYEDPLVEVEQLTEKIEPKLYQASKKESYLENYTPHEYGNYEKQKEKQREGFKPSPIISPIYGIVEDTRFMNKEPRREVRITTAVSHEKMNLDAIRKKAFGNLSDDIGENVGLNNNTQKIEVNDDDNVLLDLSNDKTPEVNEITVGDAVEYFEDLGLEYNEDYIDSSKVTRAQKNASLNEEVEEDLDATGNIEEDLALKDDNASVDDQVIVREVNDDNSSSGDSENLFDLIDSMYE